jgi:hypothetical protein
LASPIRTLLRSGGGAQAWVSPYRHDPIAFLIDAVSTPHWSGSFDGWQAPESERAFARRLTLKLSRSMVHLIGEGMDPKVRLTAAGWVPWSSASLNSTGAGLTLGGLIGAIVSGIAISDSERARGAQFGSLLEPDERRGERTTARSPKCAGCRTARIYGPLCC